MGLEKIRKIRTELRARVTGMVSGVTKVNCLFMLSCRIEDGFDYHLFSLSDELKAEVRGATACCRGGRSPETVRPNGGGPILPSLQPRPDRVLPVGVLRLQQLQRSVPGLVTSPNDVAHFIIWI